MRRAIVLSAVCVWLFVLASGPAQAAPATGPLKISTENPRYFEDETGKVVYLTGSHTWEVQQDLGPNDPPRAFDYTAFLDLMVSYNHNFMRYWMYETAKFAPWYTGDYYYNPVPWARPGPELAPDGKPKFDLTQYNQAYFDRMRARVIEARDRGIYCAVMMFQGWSIIDKAGGSEPWDGHPFNAANNINGIDGDTNGDGNGLEIHTLADPAVTALQEAYVRKVIDTVNDLDSVLYEIGNECDGSSDPWQYHMIDYIHDYEANNKPKQYMVGMTVDMPGGNNAALFASPADWISPNGGGGYADDPPAADGSKIILNDTDHLWGGGGSRPWVWKSFCRGLQPLIMDAFDQHVLGANEAVLTEVRAAARDTKAYADKMNLAAMTPQNSLASTTYCLANAVAQGAEYLVYIPAGGACTVDLSATSGTLAVEWFDPVIVVETQDGGTVQGGAVRSFTAPWDEAVLYLDGATNFFVAEPASIAEGGVSILSWRITDGTNVQLDGEAVAASGSRPVAPSATTTYTLTADTPAGAYSEQVTVTVGSAAVLTSIEVSPDGVNVITGGKQTFTAQPLDQYGNPMAAAVSWSVSGGGSVDPATGNVTVFTSDGTEDAYTLTASSGGVDGTADFTVSPVLMKVNCGPNTPAVAGWQTDNAYVTGGQDYTFPGTADTTGVANAAPADVYKTCRHLDHSYSFPSVPDGTYTVRLHFYDEYATDGREMDYTIEGVMVLDGFSIVQEVGAGKALVKEFSVDVTDGNGLQIVAAADTGNDVFEGGIEILTTGGAPQPDLQNPTVQVTSPQDSATVSGIIVVSGTASDDAEVASVEVSVDGGSFALAAGTADWSYTINTTELTDGARTITARATDTSGNTAEATVTVTVDNAPPAVTITAPLDGATVSGTATVEGTASDNGTVSLVEVQVDAGAYEAATGTTSWTYSLDTTALTDGSHTINVRATDDAANSATASVTVTVDNAAPTVTITAPLAGATVNSTVSIEGTASDDGTVTLVEVQVDSAAYEAATGTTSWTYSLDTTALADGSHTVNVRATDDGANTATASVTVTVDNPAAGDPTVTITAPASGATVSGTVSIEGTASDDGTVATVEVQVDAGAYEAATGTTSWTYSLDTTALADGGHTINVRATDDGANIAIDSVTVTVDNAADGDGGDGKGCAAGTGGAAFAVLALVLGMLRGARRGPAAASR